MSGHHNLTLDEKTILQIKFIYNFYNWLKKLIKLQDKLTPLHNSWEDLCSQ